MRGIFEASPRIEASAEAIYSLNWRVTRPGDAGKERTGIALAALALETAGVPLALVWFTIASCGIMAAYPSLWAMPTSFLTSAAAAASIGMINSFGNLGGFAGPYLIGWFSSRSGDFTGGTWTMVAGLLFSGVCAILVRPRARER